MQKDLDFFVFLKKKEKKKERKIRHWGIQIILYSQRISNINNLIPILKKSSKSYRMISLHIFVFYS